MAAKVRVSPQQGATNWQNRFGGSGEAYRAGVNAVQEAPNQAAARALPRWIESVTSQKVKDKYVAKNNAVTLEQWKKNASEIGAGRLSSGAQKGVSKMQAFATSFYPFLDAGLAKISSMPNVTLEDRVNRAVAMMRYNATFKG